MAYATPEQLALALHIQVSAQNQQVLQDCVEAAATEIDHVCDRYTPMPDPAPSLIVRVNIDRGVEWFKAAEATFGGIGYNNIGNISVHNIRTPPDNMERYALTLLPFRQQWGVA